MEYRPTQSFILFGSINPAPALIGRGKGGNVTSTGWQVTLCDPIWHVSSRSSEAFANRYTRLLYLLTLLYMLVTLHCLLRRLPLSNAAIRPSVCLSHAPSSKKEQFRTVVITEQETARCKYNPLINVAVPKRQRSRRLRRFESIR